MSITELPMVSMYPVTQFGFGVKLTMAPTIVEPAGIEYATVALFLSSALTVTLPLMNAEHITRWDTDY